MFLIRIFFLYQPPLQATMPPKGSKLDSAEKKRRADVKAAALAKGDEYLATLNQEHEEEMEDLRKAMRRLEVELDNRLPPARVATVATAAHKGKVDMPVFWEEDVDMWFEQVEAGFR